VAIDIFRIRDFGVGTYIRNLVRSLSRLDRESEYLLIGVPERLREIGELPPNFEIIPYSRPQGGLRLYLEFARILRQRRCDLVHIPHLYWVPRYVPCPYVVTVHDLLDHFYPVGGDSNFRRALHFRLTRRVLRHAARIFAVSRCTRNDLAQLFALDGGRIEVVYNAIDERFRLGHAGDADRQFIAERYQVNYPFLLYAGAIKPHKNVVRIIEAFSALKAELVKDGKFPDLKLIIIGDELSAPVSYTHLTLPTICSV